MMGEVLGEFFQSKGISVKEFGILCQNLSVFLQIFREILHCEYVAFDLVRSDLVKSNWPNWTRSIQELIQ